MDNVRTPEQGFSTTWPCCISFPHSRWRAVNGGNHEQIASVANSVTWQQAPKPSAEAWKSGAEEPRSRPDRSSRPPHRIQVQCCAVVTLQGTKAQDMRGSTPALRRVISAHKLGPLVSRPAHLTVPHYEVINQSQGASAPPGSVYYHELISLGQLEIDTRGSLIRTPGPP